MYTDDVETKEVLVIAVIRQSQAGLFKELGLLNDAQLKQGAPLGMAFATAPNVISDSAIVRSQLRYIFNTSSGEMHLKSLRKHALAEVILEKSTESGTYNIVILRGDGEYERFTGLDKDGVQKEMAELPQRLARIVQVKGSAENLVEARTKYEADKSTQGKMQSLEVDDTAAAAPASVASAPVEQEKPSVVAAALRRFGALFRGSESHRPAVVESAAVAAAGVVQTDLPSSATRQAQAAGTKAVVGKAIKKVPIAAEDWNSDMQWNRRL